MNRSYRIGITVAAAAVLPLVLAQKAAETPKPATDGSGTYQIDPVHSSNCFRIKHMNVAYFYGRFNDVSGTFTLGDTAEVSVKVKAASPPAAGIGPRKQVSRGGSRRGVWSAIDPKSLKSDIGIPCD